MEKRKDLQFAIIGIGAFGSALAKKLSEEGAYVITIDNNMDHINQIKEFVTDAICFDATDTELLESHGISEVDVAIISIGEAFEPVALIAMHLLDSGVKEVYGRAESYIQEQILKKIGITDVIHPERQVGERMGISLMRRGVSDIYDISDDLSIFETEVPESMIGYTLEELKIRERYQLNVITIKRLKSSEKSDADEKRYEVLGIVTGTTRAKKGDHFLLVGSEDNMDKMMETN